MSADELNSGDTCILKNLRITFDDYSSKDLAFLPRLNFLKIRCLSQTLHCILSSNHNVQCPLQLHILKFNWRIPFGEIFINFQVNNSFLTSILLMLICYNWNFDWDLQLLKIEASICWHQWFSYFEMRLLAFVTKWKEGGKKEKKTLAQHRVG